MKIIFWCLLELQYNLYEAPATNYVNKLTFLVLALVLMTPNQILWQSEIQSAQIHSKIKIYDMSEIVLMHPHCQKGDFDDKMG